jgi:hypothetical protein
VVRVRGEVIDPSKPSVHIHIHHSTSLHLA